MSRTRFVSVCALGMVAYLVGHAAGKQLGRLEGMTELCTALTNVNGR